MTDQLGSHSPKQAGELDQGPPGHGRRHSRRGDFKNTVLLYLVVGLGSVIGGTGRWHVSEIMHAGLGDGFPFGTLAVNITGSFLIGFYDALSGPNGRLFASPRQRQFVMTGICGGFTTFSIFSLESVRLIEVGRFPTAGLFVGASVVGWLAAVWAGHALATSINYLRRT
jgi:CrcB protein